MILFPLSFPLSLHFPLCNSGPTSLAIPITMTTRGRFGYLAFCHCICVFWGGNNVKRDGITPTVFCPDKQNVTHQAT